MVKPDKENEELGRLIEPMDTAMLPVFFRVIDCEVELLTARVPKLMDEGETERAGAAFSPEPESGTVTGILRSELAMISEPAVCALLEGAKTMLRLACFPGASSTGDFTGESAKPAPEILKF